MENETNRLDDWRAIIAVAIEQAKAGDSAARDWLGRYVLKDERLRELAGLPSGSSKSNTRRCENATGWPMQQ